MTARNDITGDALITKSSTDAYREGYDRIFGKKKQATIVISMEDIPVTTPEMWAEIEAAARDPELAKKRKNVAEPPHE